LGYIIAEELGKEINLTSGPALERPADMMPYLVNATEGDIIFIDEITVCRAWWKSSLFGDGRFRRQLYAGQGLYSKPLPFQLKRFTLIGATTRPAMLSRPMRDRFGISSTSTSTMKTTW
jgi:Holliday junction DNA helicase RuvB